MTSSSSSHLTIEDAGRNFQDFSEEHVKCCSNTLIAKNQRWIMQWYERCSFAELKALQAAEIWGKRKFQPQWNGSICGQVLSQEPCISLSKAAAGLKQMGKLPPDQLKSYLKVSMQRPWSIKKTQKQPLHPYILKDQTTQPHQTLKHQLDLTWYYLSRDKEPRAERLWKPFEKMLVCSRIKQLEPRVKDKEPPKNKHMLLPLLYELRPLCHQC